MFRIAAAIIVLGLLAAGSLLLKPDALVNDVPVPALPEDLNAYLSESEQAVAAISPLIPRTEKRIHWQTEGERTEYSIVYLPGFSATRQEIAPTCELVANALGANLFETRLAGHGLTANALVGVSAEDWLADAAEALTIGARLGERVVLIGTSTGATLAVAMSGHPLMQPVHSLILLSPNFRPVNGSVRWLTRPGGELLTRYVLDESRTWTPYNRAQGLYWTTTYPTAALVEMMRVVDFAQAQLPLELEAAVLMMLSPGDTVVSAAASLDALERIRAPRKRLIEMSDVGDPAKHVLAGHILSPETTDAVAQNIVEFIRSGERGD